MHMYQFYGHALLYEQVIEFLLKMTFDPCYLNVPRLTFDPIIEVEGIKLMYIY